MGLRTLNVALKQPQSPSQATHLPYLKNDKTGTSTPNVAYFSMEIAVDQRLNIYSGGLGYLAGSHMRSAGQLGLPMVGVTILWGYGYGQQVIRDDNTVDIVYSNKAYDFLDDINVTVPVTIFGETVQVKAFRLKPETFGSVPLYLLSTDIPENPEHIRALTKTLYDGEQRARISQEIILGVGGYRALKAAGEPIDIVHLNEGHALPAAFEMIDEHHGNHDDVRRRLVFTTHTPVAAGNETHPVQLLSEAGFFVNTPIDTARWLGGEDFSLTVAALKLSRIANGVSQLHGEVANDMWEWVDGRCEIKAITNAVNKDYWQDSRLTGVRDLEQLIKIKKEMKMELIDYIKEKSGVTLKPDVMTIVWARRFTAYKRPTMIFDDLDRISKLLKDNKVQLLYAGKFHPKDETGRQAFNQVIAYSKTLPNVTILPTYELEMSGMFKRGADVWLNTPLRPMEASGTSGMSANLNGTLHFSTFDGWAVEGTFHGINGYLINPNDEGATLTDEERRKVDYESMMTTLENDIIPTFYNRPMQWAQMMQHAIHASGSYFDSHRMAIEYYIKLYEPVRL